MRASSTPPRVLAAIVAALTLLLFPALAAGQTTGQAATAGIVDSSVQTVIEATGGDQSVPVIISAPGAEQRVIAALPRGVKVTRLPGIDSLAAFLTPAQIEKLAASGLVAGIVADNPVFGLGTANSMSVTGLTIGLADIVPWNQGGPDGAGVTVAIIDTGISANSDLAAARIVGWKDFVNGQTAPYDDAGHGTFVAGLIAGDGSASLPVDAGGHAATQFRGVAPAADLVGIKVLDKTGQGRASDLIAGIFWAIEHKDEYGIKVLNISVGGNPVSSVKHDPVARAVELAWLHGIVVVCAAGNEGEFGRGSILSPGNDPFVITVGATDTRQTANVRDDAVAAYSSQGPTLYDEVAKPDLVAPGNRLISLRTIGSYIDTAFPENIVSLTEYAPAAPAGTLPSYIRLSGTSTSAPLVAGTAALMLSEDPSLTPDDVKVRLMRTADPVAGAKASQQGAGTLDVDQALDDTSRADGYALSASAGKGKSLFKESDYRKWESRSWSKYGWTKFKWTKFKWTKFKWTKFKWTENAWSEYSSTKFKWTEYEWAKFKWTILIQGQ